MVGTGDFPGSGQGIWLVQHCVSTCYCWFSGQPRVDRIAYIDGTHNYTFSVCIGFDQYVMIIGIVVNNTCPEVILNGEQGIFNNTEEMVNNIFPLTVLDFINMFTDKIDAVFHIPEQFSLHGWMGEVRKRAGHFAKESAELPHEIG